MAIEVGNVLEGRVTGVKPFGAFVALPEGKSGMVHISELQWQRTEKVEDVVKVGDMLKVKCVEYDAVEGKTRLSLKQMSAPPAGWAPPPPRTGGFRGGGGRGGPPRAGGFRR